MKNKKEKIMKNSIFLERASKLQKEYAELYGMEGGGVIGMNKGNFQIRSEVFRKCEKEGLLEHVSETLTEERDYWRLQAMTQDGIIVIALEDLDERKA